MLKVLIVENEALERVHLKTLIDWRAHEYDLVGEAENGGEALRLIDRLVPDIVITDIRMPVLNGLELIAARRSVDRGPEFLIMSGYDDYELVRRGLTLGAYDYLRKLDLDSKTLLGALHGMRAKIGRAIAEANHRGASTGLTKSAARAWFVAELLKGYPRGKESYVQDLEKLNVNLDPQNMCCAYIRVVETDRFEEDLLNDTNTLSQSVLSIAEEICRDSFYVSCFEGSPAEFLIFASPRGAKSEFEPTIERLLEMLSIYLNLHAKAGLSECTARAPQSPDDAETLPMVLAARRAQAALKSGVAADGRNLLSWRESRGRDSRAVREAENYIATRYGEDLSINHVAVHVSLSPNYLSSLFKRHTGLSFTDYLNKVRIQASKRMLAETDLLIYQIAENCGYRDSYYFNRVFKKLTGTSPGKFKNGDNA